jgi:hypothetical protein
MRRVFGVAIALLVLLGAVGFVTAQKGDGDGKKGTKKGTEKGTEKKADKKDAKPAPVPTEEILDQLSTAFKNKHEPSSVQALEKAVVAIKEPKRSTKEKSQILRGMQQGLVNKNDRVKLATVSAMGRIGPPGARPLTKVLKAKVYQRNRELLAAVIDSLGLTRDERTAVSALLRLVSRESDWGVRAWAARALGNFDKNVARGRTRRKITETLIQIYEGIQSKMKSDPRDSDARRKHDAIQGDFVATLRILTEQEWNNAFDWRKWYNKNKKRRSAWPDPPKKKKPKK